MNWIKENKFLSVFLSVTLVGAGALAFLMVSAMGKAAAAQSNYDSAAAELTRLQNSAPYPDAGNLAQMEDKKKDHKASIEELQRNLAGRQIALNPATTQAQFQDKLRETVNRVKAAAAGGGVKLPEKFYMSFDRYETEQPKPEAAAPLLRLLESMEKVVNMLIDNNVTEITELKRDTLPEEGAKPGTGAAKPSAKEEGGKALVVRHPFEVGFIAQETKFHKFINAVVKEEKQFYIPKHVAVKNEKEQGPSRAVKDPTKPDAGAEIVVGEEKLQVVVKIDVVNFPSAAPAKADTPKADTPKADAPKADAPKADAPEADTPK